ncbi:DUF11 domain-containing protein [Chryseobacterium sp. PBS4-4]|uniref:DUF11 domain-containing protein n=1 Tax=Chryseobacterium edaphi TaxID=2976532 RepID=A0ABT2W7P3_9FLAO|nr:DUF11 domain-containing protein [Chryseobacterium edaphi]MCU7618231.1 DUF11 domain-containing protein [Chryseobacterium edaphi]
MKFKNTRYYKKQLILLMGLISGVVFSQTYPDLEMGNVTPSTATSTNLTVALQKDTNNNTGTTLVNYSTPTPLTVSYIVNSTNFTNAVRFGTAGVVPFYSLMNAFGNTGSDNGQYTSNGVATNGTGIDVASNYAASIQASLASAGSQAGNGRVKLGEITINLSRGTHNPNLHFKGLGEAGTGASVTAEFTVKSVLNSSGAEILSSTTILGLSGTNLTVTNAGKTINNSYTGTTTPDAANSARGTVRFQSNDIKTIVLEVYGNRNGGNATAVTWTNTDSFLIGLSAGESDLQVTQSVSTNNPTVGGNVTFTIIAANRGASNNTNVVVNDILPSGFTFVSATTSVGSYNSANGVWTVGTLIDGANATLSLIGTMTRNGSYLNTATITSDLTVNDPNSANNTSSAQVFSSDTDGDGILNSADLDNDNDGILDTVENSCIASAKVEGPPIFSNDFGTGSTTGTDPYVVGHGYAAVNPSDGNYSVTTSETQTVFYTKTNANGDLDAGYNEITSGSKAGRFLMINVNSAVTTASPIYRVTGLNVVPGVTYRFRLDMAGLAETPGNSVPSLQLTIKDGSNNQLATANSNSINMANDDIWRRLTLEFTATTSTVNLEIYNLQSNGGGNDLGIDNIVFTPLLCDLDGDGIPNQLDLDSDNDGCFDAFENTGNVTPVQAPSGYIMGATNSNGIPTIAGTGLGIGASQNAAQNRCNDNDLDGVPNNLDLDDDNDGILDSDEKACGPDSILSLSGYKGFVYNSTAALDSWTQINGSTTFPTAGFTQVATFDYIENASTLNAFNVNFDASGNISGTNVDMVNYRGTALSPPSRDYAVLFSKTINADEVGTYQYNLINADNHVFVYVNGVKVASRQNVYNTSLPVTNFVTVTVALGDKIDILLVEEDAGNTYININAAKTVGQCMLDTDGDGIPDHFDTDSDGDGCFDAIEGAANITSGQLNSNNQISGAVDANGIPTAANGGQGIGRSQDGSKNDCTDSDGDLIPDWQDLDDDNDGILDTNECSLNLASYVGNNFSTAVPAIPGSTSDNTKFLQLRPSDFGLTTAGATNQTATRDYSSFFGLPAGSIIVTVENAHVHPNATSNPSSNVFYVSGRNGIGDTRVRVTGTLGSYVAIEHGQEYYGLQERSIKFYDGSHLTASNLYNINTQPNTGNWQSGSTGRTYFVRHTTAATENGVLAYGVINTEINPKVIGVSTNNAVTTEYSTFFIRIFPECDSDKDGIPNRLDLDSDGDGCPDVIEGGANFTTGATYITSNRINTGVNASGVPNVPTATPVITNYTQAAGQGSGNSQNNTLNDCKCYKTPTTTTGTDNPTLHGITAFNRAGANNSNWPMLRNNGWTALEANTKAFVMNRMPSAPTVNPGEPLSAVGGTPVITSPIIGMTYYDTRSDCMRVNIDGTRTGWKCFDTQSCPDEN